ncbi:MAG: HAD family hydrolase [Erysipelotrichaceae bacterium]|nr:HAD family hydrolase [Erysipelotrichaceae bacterium]
MKNYKAYIFDLYGTLIDIHTDEYRTSFWKKMKEVFFEYDALYEYPELKKEYFDCIKRLEKRDYQKGHDTEIDIAEVFEYLLKNKKVQCDEKIIRELASVFRQYSTTHIRVYAGVKDLLSELRKEGKKVFLLSNAQYLFTMRELKELDLEIFFNEIFISSQYGYKKPDKKFFEVLLKKYKLKPEECLMIGNDPISDIKGGENCGMDTYYIHSGLSPKEKHKIKATYSQPSMNIKLLSNRINFRKQH